MRYHSNFFNVDFWEKQGITKESKNALSAELFFQYVGKDTNVLDIGSGKGRILHKLNQNKFKGNIILIDRAKPLLELAQNDFYNFTTSFCVGDCRELPFKENLFDLCILSSILTCFILEDDLLKIIDEIYRCLKISGHIYISDFLFYPTPRNFIRYCKGYSDYSKLGCFSTKHHTFRHYFQKDLEDLLRVKMFLLKKIIKGSTKSWNNNSQKGIEILAMKKQ